MAKSPGKAPTTTAPKPAAIAKPKAAKKTAGNGAAVKPAAAKTAAMPTKTAAKPAKPAAKPAKPAKIKTKAESKSVFSETSSKISKLASDILADRIVPTIEQIKAIAASALGQDLTKGKKAKAKKKK